MGRKARKSGRRKELYSTHLLALWDGQNFVRTKLKLTFRVEGFSKWVTLGHYNRTKALEDDRFFYGDLESSSLC